MMARRAACLETELIFMEAKFANIGKPENTTGDSREIVL